MLASILNASRTSKRIVSIVYDCFALSFALYLAIALRLGSLSIPLGTAEVICLLTTLACSILAFIRLGLYRAILRFMAHQAFTTAIIGILISSLALAVSSYVLNTSVPRSVPIIYIFIALFFIGLPRALVRHAVNLLYPIGDTNVIIYGADATGHQLAASLQQGREYHPVAFIDDNKKLYGSSIRHIPVVGPKRINQLIAEHNVKQILLALGGTNRVERTRIIRSLEKYPIEVKTIPPYRDIINSRAKIEELRQVEIEDLLGRDAVTPSTRLMSKNVEGKVVMITGAGGSIGSELCREILKLSPKMLILFELNEYNLYKIEAELNKVVDAEGKSTQIAPILGSTEHKHRLETVMASYRVNTVYHAAAYKHVPLVELNLIEGIRNNLFGTWHCAEAAIASNVDTFILISTDKAVRPTNIMGASKRLAELTLQALNARQTTTIFSMVRFGNVLGSSGSVVPKFRSQIKAGGPVTVTHPEITRFFMTTKEAAQLVIQAGAMAKGGEVFVLEMGEPVKIADMAKEMIQLSGLTFRSKEHPNGEIAIEYTGLRPGEKLYEELLVGNNCQGTEHPRIMMANEDYLGWVQLNELLTSIDEHCHKLNYEALKDEIIKAPLKYNSNTKLGDLIHNQRSGELKSTFTSALKH